jgi:hypothetical protein
MRGFCGSCGSCLKTKKSVPSKQERLISHKAYIVTNIRYYYCPNGCELKTVKVFGAKKQAGEGKR